MQIKRFCGDPDGGEQGTSVAPDEAFAMLVAASGAKVICREPENCTLLRMYYWLKCAEEVARLCL